MSQLKQSQRWYYMGNNLLRYISGRVPAGQPVKSNWMDGNQRGKGDGNHIHGWWDCKWSGPSDYRSPSDYRKPNSRAHKLNVGGPFYFFFGKSNGGYDPIRDHIGVTKCEWVGLIVNCSTWVRLKHCQGTYLSRKFAKVKAMRNFL